LLKEQRMFINLLERDLPGYHGWYHHLRRKLPYNYPCNFKQNPERHNRTDSGWLLLKDRFGYAVLWSHVVFALRAESLGASYGIPLDAFAFSLV
jgi:hypothetical protein